MTIYKKQFPKSSTFNFLASLMEDPPASIGGSRCQQQREPPVEGNDSVAIGGIVLGEGVQTEYEQEYGDELFH